MKRILKKIMNRRSCGWGNARGFTLIELLIALSIFAVGILAVASMQMSSMRAGAQAGGLTQAVRGINQDFIEQLLGLGYTDPLLGGTLAGGATYNSPVPYSTQPVDGVTYITRYTVIADAAGDSKTVAVTTNWSDLGGTHAVTTTFVTDRLL